MEEGPVYDPSLTENIFQQFKGRRAGLIKALTTEVEEFFRQCDPEKGNLCLYGLPNETWKVSLPVAKVPPEVPEPVLGINFNRDRMSKKEWLTFVAIHSDSWLHFVAFFDAFYFGASKSDREHLFRKIYDLPTVSETVRGSFEKPSKEKSSATIHKSDTSKSPSDSKMGSESDIRASRGRSTRGTHKGLQIMEAGPDPDRVEKIFQEFNGRRAGLIKALTTDVEEFFRQCDPEKENLCLFGCPNGTWEVTEPAEDIPPDIPEPALCVNFARDGMTKPKWLTFVADRSDSWLLSVAFHSASRFSVCKSDRARLFSMINDLPTLSETVRGSFEKPSKEKSSATTHKCVTRKSTSGSKRGSDSDIGASRGISRRGGGVEEEDDDRMCGICNKDYSTECEFWIFCHTCGNWFHSECVNITQASIAGIKKYKCPSCCR